MHTYIHNCPLEPFSQDYGKFLTPLMCAIFMAGLFTLRVFARNLQRENPPKKFFFFIFRFDDRPGIRIRTLRLISQHTATSNVGYIHNWSLQPFSQDY